jgi:monoamine oxidase
MNRALSRRDFLQLAGAVGGSTAVFRAAVALGVLPAIAHAERPQLASLAKSRSVLILGGGISGLTAAYELSRKGYEVQVLEASFRAGGRNMTLRSGDRIDETGYPQVCQFDKDPDLYFNAGPARIPGHHQALLSYCKELEVELEPFINDNRNAWVQDDAMFGGKPIRAREYMNDSRGFVAELMAKSMKPETLAQPLTKDDWERLREYLRQFGELDPQFRYIGTSRSGLAKHDYTAPEQLKVPLSPSELLKSRFVQIMSFGETDDQAAMMMEPVGGMDRVVAGFLRKVGHLVQLESQVQKIQVLERGVEVTYRRNGLHRDTARQAVQDRPADEGAVLGARRHLRRYLVDTAGHPADLVSGSWHPSQERRGARRVHIRSERGRKIRAPGPGRSHQARDRARRENSSGLWQLRRNRRDHRLAPDEPHAGLRGAVG